MSPKMSPNNCFINNILDINSGKKYHLRCHLNVTKNVTKKLVPPTIAKNATIETQK